MIGGDEVEIPENAFTPKYSYMEEGAKVEVITVGDVIVTIAKICLIESATNRAISSFSFIASTTTNRDGFCPGKCKIIILDFFEHSRLSKCSRSSCRF